MKIGIDAHGVGGHSLGLGNETYFRNLIANLLLIDSKNEYHVFANHPEALADIAAPHANLRVVALRPHTQWIQRPLSMPLYARRHGLDIVHVPFVRPPFTGAKTIITVHDINYEVYPKDFTLTERVRMKVLVRRSCERADAIFTVSEWAKQQLHTLYRVPLEQIVVTPNAADHLQRAAVTNQQPPFELPDKFILFVGMIQPKKNLVRLVQAFDLLKSRAGVPHKLVIAGTWGWNNAELEETLRNSQHRDDILFPGYISQQDLGAVMPKADLFVFPSLYESFGIPPMEAQRCGVPALVSGTTCFPEIYRDSVLYCDPYSVESIASGLQVLLQDQELRSRLRASAPANLARFSWRRTAEIALAAYGRIGRQAVAVAETEGAVA